MPYHEEVCRPKMESLTSLKWWIAVFSLRLCWFGYSMSMHEDVDQVVSCIKNLTEFTTVTLTPEMFAGVCIDRMGLHITTGKDSRILVDVETVEECKGNSDKYDPALWTWYPSALTLYTEDQNPLSSHLYLSASYSVTIQIYGGPARGKQFKLLVSAVKIKDAHQCIFSEDADGDTNRRTCNYTITGEWSLSNDGLVFDGDNHDIGNLTIYLHDNMIIGSRLLEFEYFQGDGRARIATMTCPNNLPLNDDGDNFSGQISCDESWSEVSIQISGEIYLRIYKITVYTYNEDLLTTTSALTEARTDRRETELASIHIDQSSQKIPTQTSVPRDTATQQLTDTMVLPRDNSMQTGQTDGVIPAVVVVVLILIGILVVGLVVWYRRRSKLREDKTTATYEDCDIVRNPSYTTVGGAGPDAALKDATIYNEIEEGEYNVLFGGKESDDYHEYNLPSGNPSLFPESKGVSNGNNHYQELPNKHPKQEPRNGNAANANNYTQLDMKEVKQHAYETEVIGKSHQDKLAPVNYDNQIPKGAPDGDLYQPLNSAVNDSRQEDPQKSNDAYDTLQRGPVGNNSARKENAAELEDYQTLDLSPSRNNQDDYETPNIPEQDRPKTLADNRQNGDVDDNYETPEPSPVKHQMCEDKKQDGAYDTLQRSPSAKPMSTTSHTVDHADDDYETPVTGDTGSNTYQTLSPSSPAADIDLESSAYQHLQRPLQQSSPTVSLDQVTPEDHAYGKLDLSDHQAGQKETHEYATLEKPANGQTPEDPEYFVLDNSDPDATADNPEYSTLEETSR